MKIINIIISSCIILCAAGLNVQAQEHYFWPPVLGREYPKDVKFHDQTGELMTMAAFEGKIIFIEYVGMNCPACQAFSGANKPEIGAFKNNAVQVGLDSIEQYFNLYAGGVKFSDERVVYVAILLYDMTLGQPKVDDARKWAEHFKLSKDRQEYVFVANTDLRSDASYNLIPGFQLLDKTLLLRSDSSGHHPKQDLYRTLLPMVAVVVEE
ncbi:MAG: hypothetical protein ACI9E5_000401 [Candidatus Omnitrophota bacterium]